MPAVGRGHVRKCARSAVRVTASPLIAGCWRSWTRARSSTSWSQRPAAPSRVWKALTCAPQRSRSFSPDGSRLVVTTPDGPAVHVWDLRAIRKHLTKMGLDFYAPPYSDEEAADRSRQPLPPLRVDYGPPRVTAPRDTELRAPRSAWGQSSLAEANGRLRLPSLLEPLPTRRRTNHGSASSTPSCSRRWPTPRGTARPANTCSPPLARPRI